MRPWAALDPSGRLRGALPFAHHRREKRRRLPTERTPSRASRTGIWESVLDRRRGVHDARRYAGSLLPADLTKEMAVALVAQDRAEAFEGRCFGRRESALTVTE